MARKKIRIGMLVYSVIFVLLAILSIMDDIESNYHALYVLCGSIIYLLVIAGNFFYVFNYSNEVIKKYWKAMPFIFAVYSVVSCVVDKNFGAHKETIDILVWFILILVIFPTLRANFILGYKKQYPPPG